MSQSHQIYQIKISLRDAKPPIWRRVLIPADFALDQLHQVIQTAMGWENYHLHMFTIDGNRYSDAITDPDGELGTIDETKYKLHQLISGEGFRFEYEYDFGDGWDHRLLVEKILTVQPDVRYPTCIKGKRNCPPEDVGGIWGYEEFLKAIQDPNHPQHADYMEWRGMHDSEAFDLEKINQALTAHF